MKLVHRIGYNPVVMRLFAKYGYPLMTRWAGGQELLFLGPGYEEDPPMAIALTESDQPDRFPIQLYHRLATEADLAGKRVLEVSCGHGGGASYLVRTFHPASYVGLDLNPAAIDFCRRHHVLPALEFVQGDAEKLPFDDESFDVVLNVEASHSYPHFSTFLAEVARVLRPGGVLLYADLRIADRVEEWDTALHSAPMTVRASTVINAEIIRGYELNSQQRRDQIGEHVPRFFRSFAGDFAGVEGSGNYQALKSGELSYRRYTLTKP